MSRADFTGFKGFVRRGGSRGAGSKIQKSYGTAFYGMGGDGIGRGHEKT